MTLKLFVLILVVIAVGHIALFPNSYARSFGGDITVEIPAGAKLINMTWKETSLWVLYQQADGQVVFAERSNFGIMQGKVFVKCKGEPK